MLEPEVNDGPAFGRVAEDQEELLELFVFHLGQVNGIGPVQVMFLPEGFHTQHVADRVFNHALVRIVQQRDCVPLLAAHEVRQLLLPSHHLLNQHFYVFLVLFAEPGVRHLLLLLRQLTESLVLS